MDFLGSFEAYYSKMFQKSEEFSPPQPFRGVTKVAYIGNNKFFDKFFHRIAHFCMANLLM